MSTLICIITKTIWFSVLKFYKYIHINVVNFCAAPRPQFESPLLEEKEKKITTLVSPINPQPCAQVHG